MNGLPYGLKKYIIGEYIHVLISGYSYRAKVVDYTKKTVIVLVNDIKYEIQKTNTFR